MPPKPYTCVLDPDTKTILRIYLFKNVQNVGEIRSNVLSGAWQCAIVKPSLILDPLQVAVAANRAAVANTLNSMVTKTIYSEILYNLSLSKKIAQSLTKFGIEKGQELLICFLETSEDNSTDIIAQIAGDVCPISELSAFTDMTELKTAYKLNNLKDVDLLDVIVSRMVTKNFVTH